MGITKKGIRSQTEISSKRTVRDTNPIISC